MTDKKVPSKPVNKKTSVTKAAAASTAATEKAMASKASEIKAAAEKISESDKLLANNAIKSKASSDDLKARASEAKQRAQQKILDKSYVSDKVEDPLERLANTFDSSAKRWEMVVYPSLFAFVLLAGYGFFLIYRLTHDIAVLSQSVTHMAVIVADVMPRMSKDLTHMTGSVNSMTNNIEGMSGNIGGMTNEIGSMSTQMDSLTPMSKNIESMTNNLGSMNRSVYGMQRDMHGMNRTVSSGPFGMMNDMMPFSSSSNVPRTMQQPPVWSSYRKAPKNNYYRQPQRFNHGARPNVAAPPVKQVKNKTNASEKNNAKADTLTKVIEPPKSIIEYKKKMSESRAASESLNVPNARPVSLKK